MDAPARHDSRVAIEALRAGVPNRAATYLLGISEPAIEQRFTRDLAAAAGGEAAPGLIVSGGFGSGKSHLLTYLRELALKENFVVSWVTVSKETPLFQPGPVFAAAMRSARVPNSPDDAVAKLLADVQRRQTAVQALELWTSMPESGVAQLFGAVTHLLARELPPELMQGIEAFLSGDKPPTKLVRQQLAKRGARGLFELTGAKAVELQQQRPHFMAKLIREAGYAGWCVLIDEVELIGRYGPMQRATAYAELAQWLGLEKDRRIPGLVTVAAITDDFAAEVINNRQDDEKLPERLRDKGRPQDAARATRAMRAIQAAPVLAPPGDADLARHATTLAACYAAAYDWPAPPATMVERRANRTMRHHVRAWITEWDMLRLQGATARIEVAAMVSDYSESEALSVAPDDEPAES